MDQKKIEILFLPRVKCIIIRTLPTSSYEPYLPVKFKKKMNAVTNNQNKKNFILEDEVLGMAAEDRNVLINAEQNKKKFTHDDKLKLYDDLETEKARIIQLKSAGIKFNFNNPNRVLLHMKRDFSDIMTEELMKYSKTYYKRPYGFTAFRTKAIKDIKKFWNYKGDNLTFCFPPTHELVDAIIETESIAYRKANNLPLN